MGAETSKNPNNLDAVVEILTNTSSENQVSGWVSSYGLFNTTVGAVSNSAALAALQSRECTYIVETASMEIVWKDCTGTNGQPPFSINNGLVELDALLNP